MRPNKEQLGGLRPSDLKTLMRQCDEIKELRRSVKDLTNRVSKLEWRVKQ